MANNSPKPQVKLVTRMKLSNVNQLRPSDSYRMHSVSSGSSKDNVIDNSISSMDKFAKILVKQRSIPMSKVLQLQRNIGNDSTQNSDSIRNNVNTIRVKTPNCCLDFSCSIKAVPDIVGSHYPKVAASSPLQNLRKSQSMTRIQDCCSTDSI